MNRRFPLTSRHWVLVTALLLLIAASRSLRWPDLLMNPDEVWSVWQSVGSPLEIIRRTPYDWPPGYFLLMGFWQALVGTEPLRMRTACCFCDRSRLWPTDEER